jgi:argininosuccinate lyase
MNHTQKLWHTHQSVPTIIEQFTTGDDLSCDQKLAPYDMYGSLAHIQALHKLGILSENELLTLQHELKHLFDLWEKGQFYVQLGDEDIHTKIELTLTKNVGEAGKKLHTGRSRNDQVLTTMRLYEKAELFSIAELTTELVETLLMLSHQHRLVSMAGFTHTQPAMPSSLGLWFASYADGVIDALQHITHTVAFIDQSPLGTAAGYGVALNLDRTLVAHLLGFTHVQLTAPYAQQSRLTFEILIIESLLTCLLHINTFASDILFFASEPLSYLKVSDIMCTGSSIMPHKKNVDVAELLRAQYHKLVGNLTELLSLKGNLISGYHRDFQVSKKTVIESLEITKQSLIITKALAESIHPQYEKMRSSVTNNLFSVDAILHAVFSGVPFRDAYHNWQSHLGTYLKNYDTNLHASLGSTKYIPFKELKKKLTGTQKNIHNKHLQFTTSLKKLLCLKGTYVYQTNL